MPSRYGRFRTHRRSRRLAGHDYAAPGWTFVTVCTAHRRAHFGEVRDGVMGLNEVGRLAHACWAEIPDHVGSVRLGAFVVMPNHVHGMIGIEATGETEAPLHPTALRSDGTSRLAPTAGSVSVVVRLLQGGRHARRPARGPLVRLAASFPRPRRAGRSRFATHPGLHRVQSHPVSR